jgi:hypothetical protein
LFNNHNYRKIWNNQITKLKTSSYLLIFHENLFFIFFEINIIKDPLIWFFSKNWNYNFSNFEIFKILEPTFLWKFKQLHNSWVEAKLRSSTLLFAWLHISSYLGCNMKTRVMTLPLCYIVFITKTTMNRLQWMNALLGYTCGKIQR